MPAPFPSPQEGLTLHQRLLQGDPTATADLAAAYLEPLAARLAAHHRGLDPHLCSEAAGAALLALMRNPQSYDPGRGLSLERYLCMSATCDLRNLLRKERKHWEGRISLHSVELSASAGNYLGRDDDPSLPLQIAEQARAAERRVAESVWRGLTVAERRVLELMLEGERRTAVFAGALGVAHWPVPEQRREVKRTKDRLQKRLERAGGDDE